MSESQENIEAKLSAFIEGDLDAAGRAEIEQHLAANPSHRKLLDELRRTREFVRGLPRAAAPPELVETLQGQLERSTLLDGIGEEERALQLSSSRWPQFVSIAAVVLLAVGLATVVYVALPSGSERPAVTQNTGDGADALKVAATVPASRPTTSVSTITVGAVAARTERAAEAMATATAAAPSTTLPATPAVADVVAGAGTAAEGVRGAAVTDATRAFAPATAVPPPVAPAIPNAAGPLAKPSEVDIEALAFADADRAGAPRNVTEKLMKDVGPVAAADVPADAVHVVVNATDPARANADVTAYLNSNQIAYENVLPEPGQRQVAQDDQQQNYKPQNEIQSMAKAIPPQAAEQAQGRDANAAQQAMRPAAPNVAPGMVATDNNGAFGTTDQKQLVVPQHQQQLLARGLTRQQVVSLKSAVSKGTAQDAQVIEPAWMGGGGKLVADRADAIRPGDEIEITVDELVGAGVEKSNRARVNADGTVNMPMVEPIPAAGQTTDELSKSIARRYVEASLIQRPTVSVAMAKKSDVTADAAKAKVAGDGPTTGPTTTTAPTPTATATAAPGPTTESTAAAADAPVDVLITVNAIAAAAPAIAPAVALPATTLPVAPAPSTVPATRPVTAAPSTAPAP